MTYAHAATQEPLDAELDEWGQQRARMEDERRELKRRDTPVDFMELNNRTCRQPSDIDGNPPSLVLGQLLCLQRFGVVVPREDVRECLPVGIADGVAARDLGRAKAAESDE